MGLFNNLFGSKNEGEEKKETKIPWIALTSIEQLDEIERKSLTTPQVIFKHSTTCGISRMVLNMFTQNYAFEDGQMDFYFLDLHSYRQVSDETGYKFQVMHQSPQLLVIKNGGVVVHDSHGAITDINLQKYL
ncbi:bacillithiol system redox-active protein YtxJ [Zobellia amurskyensis]|uniref:Bacillithiol system redox-active protein YtxJ n=1 Tax=Zobellia amurskyensis TaxID=248905 RepID=A0A7X2ZRY9_9FLAO|nr:bacillithiol system redox-active protein YtxJ [Zobellia amurskyensis]MUH35278.1 bacillithiol system redox-active protein YtxJ [Zobellia amurskyensis]